MHREAGLRLAAPIATATTGRRWGDAPDDACISDDRQRVDSTLPLEKQPENNLTGRPDPARAFLVVAAVTARDESLSSGYDAWPTERRGSGAASLRPRLDPRGVRRDRGPGLRIDERVLLMREMPVQSPFSINLMFDRLEGLARDWDRFSYVVDLREARRPDAETRAALKERAFRVSPRVAHVAIVVEGNLLMRAMARLLRMAWD